MSNAFDDFVNKPDGLQFLWLLNETNTTLLEQCVQSDDIGIRVRALAATRLFETETNPSAIAFVFELIEHSANGSKEHQLAVRSLRAAHIDAVFERVVEKLATATDRHRRMLLCVLENASLQSDRVAALAKAWLNSGNVKKQIEALLIMALEPMEQNGLMYLPHVLGAFTHASPTLQKCAAISLTMAVDIEVEAARESGETNTPVSNTLRQMHEQTNDEKLKARMMAIFDAALEDQAKDIAFIKNL